VRRLPPPWRVEAIDAGFKIVDANRRSIAYVYDYDERDAETAMELTLDDKDGQ